MSTVKYCDAPECEVSNQSEELFSIMPDVAEALINKKWIQSKFRAFTNQNENQIVGIVAYTPAGKKTILPRCGLCKYVELNIDDTLICTHKCIANPLIGDIGTKDDGYCELFGISEEMLSDIADGCIS